MSIKNNQIYIDRYERFFHSYKTIYNLDPWYDIKFNEALWKIDSFFSKNNILGNILEIGVFRGLSFIPLRMLLKDTEEAVAVDIFDKYYNHELDDEIFKNNVISIFDNLDHIHIIKDSTKNLDKKNFALKNELQYRIISVDGGHMYDDVITDLTLAKDILHKDGVVIIDDYLNSSWPEVKIGVDDFLKKNEDIRTHRQYLHHNKLLLTFNKSVINKYI